MLLLKSKQSNDANVEREITKTTNNIVKDGNPQRCLTLRESQVHRAQNFTLIL